MKDKYPVTFVVRNKENKEKISEAKVILSLNSTILPVATDEKNNNFSGVLKQNTKYQIIASAPNFEDLTQEITLESAQKPELSFEFLLIPKKEVIAASTPKAEEKVAVTEKPL